MSVKKNVADEYTKLSQYYDDWFSSGWPQPIIDQAEAIQGIFQDYKVPQGGRILDLTCGIGTQSTGLASKGYAVTAMDISEGQLAKAKEEIIKFDPSLNVNWILGDAQKPSEFVSGKYDAVISFANSLPLLGSHEAMRHSMEDAYSLLNDGGLLLVSMRDHTALRQKQPYLIDSGALNHGERQGAWIETGEWLEGGKQYRSHIIFVLTAPEHEQHHFPFNQLAAITKLEFMDMLADIGFKDISFWEHAEHPYFDCEGYAAVK